MIVTPAIVGNFVDSIARKKRTPSAISGRVIEEAVELGLATGLTPGQVMEHVVDSLHNQALKLSAKMDRTIFPSQLLPDPDGIAEECADVSLVLKDLCHVARVDLESEESIKHEKFILKSFRIAENGTIYTTKNHVKT